jgi:hypothetical protein
MIQESYTIRDETNPIITVTQPLPHAACDVILSIKSIDIFLSKEEAQELIDVIRKILINKTGE